MHHIKLHIFPPIMFRLVLFLNFAFMTRKHFIVHYNLLIGKDMWTCHLPFVIGFCWSCHICDENFTLIWHFLCQNVYGMTDGEDWRGKRERVKVLYISVQFISQIYVGLVLELNLNIYIKHKLWNSLAKNGPNLRTKSEIIWSQAHLSEKIRLNCRLTQTSKPWTGFSPTLFRI